ncbi:MAG: heme o synthase [Acidimicrobiales bacterium]|jgi:protoheme IX farnesyltransferase
MALTSPPVSRLTARVVHKGATRARGYLALTKPRIVEQLLITTVPTMFAARRGLPSVALMVATVAGGALVAGGANALNMVADRDIDRLMHRTRRRPLVTGEISPGAAAVFALALELVGFGELWSTVNPLSAVLALSATLFYVLVYTLWLKRNSKQNIVIGGAAGAVPVLVGWAAVTGKVGWPALLLFAIIFLWTPPHFWALAVRYREDYRAVNVPMLPAVTTLAKTAHQIFGYSVALFATSLAFAYVGHMGVFYITAATVLGGVFISYAVGFWREQSASSAMALFRYSIVYLTLLFVAVMADVLIRYH